MQYQKGLPQLASHSALEYRPTEREQGSISEVSPCSWIGFTTPIALLSHNNDLSSVSTWLKFWLLLERRPPVLSNPWIISLGTWRASRGLSWCSAKTMQGPTEMAGLQGATVALISEDHLFSLGPEHVSNKGPCRPCYILREVQFVVSCQVIACSKPSDWFLGTLDLSSCMDMGAPSMISLVPCRSWLLMDGCLLPRRWSDTLTNCHRGVKMTCDPFWEPPATFAYIQTRSHVGNNCSYCRCGEEFR